MKALYVILALITFHRSHGQSVNGGATPTSSRSWYKDAIIYNLHIHTFQDSDGDGIGDFRGATERLDYIKWAGFNTIWLAPFFPSPYRDDGYDVTDFYAVDPSCGSLTDFKTFINEAKKRGLRVAIDIVINHTSDEHPWFRHARSDTSSPYHSWYYWAKEKPVQSIEQAGFPGVENDVWTKDKVSGQYYYHKFYNYQPHLNFTNKAVEAEADSIFKFWLSKGVDGFRLDAIPHVIEVPSPDSTKPAMFYELIPRLMRMAKKYNPEVVLIGEANIPPKDLDKFFGKQGEGLNMMFSFFANQYMFYSLATGKVRKFIPAMDSVKNIPESAQWVNFLRNHDELGITTVTEDQKQEMYKAFGATKRMQVYNRGIRRRLAPILKNDMRRLKMAYSLLFSLPGSPVVRYGDELGMGDDLSLPERFPVRTPMQWDAGKHGGFSTAEKTIRPVIHEGDYSFRKINVQNQAQDSTSLLQFIRKLTDLRISTPEIGSGEWKIIDTSQEHVLIMQYTLRKKTIYVIHNFSNLTQSIRVPVLMRNKKFEIILSDDDASSMTENLTLAPYGFRWLRPRS